MSLSTSNLIRFTPGPHPEPEVVEPVPRFMATITTLLEGVRTWDRSDAGLWARLTIAFGWVVDRICERATFTGISPIGHAPLVIDSASYIGSSCGYINPETDPPLVFYLEDPESSQTLKIGFPTENLWSFFQWPAPLVAWDPVIAATEQTPPIWFGIDDFVEVQIPMRLEFEIANPPENLATTATVAELLYESAPAFTASDYNVTCETETPWEITAFDLLYAIGPYGPGVYDLYWRIYRGAGDMIYRARCIESDLGTQMDRIVGIGGGPGIELDTDLLVTRVEVMEKPLPFVVNNLWNLGFNDDGDYTDRTKNYSFGTYSWVDSAGHVVSWNYDDDRIAIGHQQLDAPDHVVAACLVAVDGKEYAQVCCVETPDVLIYRRSLTINQPWVLVGTQGVPTASRGGLSIGNSLVPRQWRFSESGGKLACARYGPLTAIWEALITDSETGSEFGSFDLVYDLHFIDDGVIKALEYSAEIIGDREVVTAAVDVAYTVCFNIFYAGNDLIKRTARYHYILDSFNSTDEDSANAESIWSAQTKLTVKNNTSNLYDEFVTEGSHEYRIENDNILALVTTSDVKQVAIPVVENDSVFVMVNGPSISVRLEGSCEYELLVDGESVGFYEVASGYDCIHGGAAFSLPEGVDVPMRRVSYSTGSWFTEAIDFSEESGVDGEYNIYYTHDGDDEDKVIGQITNFSLEQEPSDDLTVLAGARTFFMDLFNVPVANSTTQFPPWLMVKARSYKNNALVWAGLTNLDDTRKQLYLSGHGLIDPLANSGGVPFVTSIRLASPRACLLAQDATAEIPSGDPIIPPTCDELINAINTARSLAGVGAPAQAPVISEVAVSGGLTYDAERLSAAVPGAIEQAWTIIITDAVLGTFRLDGDTLGSGVATGNLNTTLAPTNPATSTPYFTLLSEGWGGTHPEGATLIFQTSLAPMAEDSSLITTTAIHCQWMLDHSSVTEIGINGSTPLERARQAGYKGATLGEIRGTVAESMTALDVLIAAWLADSTAVAVLLNPNWTRVGGYIIPWPGTGYLACVDFGVEPLSS